MDRAYCWPIGPIAVAMSPPYLISILLPFCCLFICFVFILFFFFFSSFFLKKTCFEPACRLINWRLKHDADVRSSKTTSSTCTTARKGTKSTWKKKYCIFQLISLLRPQSTPTPTIYYSLRFIHKSFWFAF